MQTDTLQVTRFLNGFSKNSKKAYDQTFQLVYAKLRGLAREQRANWNGDYTINSTALVHEVYEKLAYKKDVEWNDRKHFYNFAATAMRHILIDYAKKRKRQKRGGEFRKNSLDEGLLEEQGDFILNYDMALQLIDLENALERLETYSERESKIVEYKIFLGMKTNEIAQMLNVSEITVKRGWRLAKAWLYNELNG